MKRLADQSLYEILEVREDAPAAEIAAACERARDLYGPGSLATYTLMTPEEAELLTKRIDEARATLLDPESRARYDEARRSGAAVAAAGGTGAGAGAPFASLPPVIPALRPPPEPAVVSAAGAADREEEEREEEEREDEPGREPEEREEGARPAILLATALQVAGAPEAVAEPPAAPEPAPILLRHEVAQPARAEAPPAVPAAPPGLPELPATPPPPFPTVPDGAWTGDALRQAREARGITVAQIAERTKVTRHHIENIEDERFGALPAPVYLRGILLSIARELRLDGQKVARAYLDRAAAAVAGKGR